MNQRLHRDGKRVTPGIIVPAKGSSEAEQDTGQRNARTPIEISDEVQGNKKSRAKGDEADGAHH